MSIDLSDNKEAYTDLRRHIGHSVVCVCYGRDGADPHNVALECEDCGEVLVSFNHPEVNE